METRSIDGGVKSVLTALDVLDCFATETELGVTDIARRLGVAKSTAHRLLTTLCARGLVEHAAGSGQYRLGMHLVELGQLAKERVPLHRLALPLLEHLRRETGQTVQLGVSDGADVLFLERLPALRPGAPSLPIARRVPAHLAGAGKVLAAFDPALERARIAAGFPAPTARSIGSAADFRLALEQVRGSGFAVADGEVVEGMASVSVPVRDPAGGARAALSVTGPSAEILAGVGRYVELLTATASRLSRSCAC
jgi:DNA-binding IclR family transcriptional regulator